MSGAAWTTSANLKPFSKAVNSKLKMDVAVNLQASRSWLDVCFSIDTQPSQINRISLLKAAKTQTLFVAPTWQEGLWENTCFELFIRADLMRGKGNRSRAPALAQRYLEFNFSPDGKWWAACFQDTRTRLAPISKEQTWIRSLTKSGPIIFQLQKRSVAHPQGSTSKLDSGCDVWARLPLDEILKFFAGEDEVGLVSAKDLRFSATMVIKPLAKKSSTASYWAVKHADQKPNFHHPKSFVMKLKKVTR